MYEKIKVKSDDRIVYNFSVAVGIELINFTFGIGFTANWTLLSDKCRLEFFKVLVIYLVSFQIPGYTCNLFSNMLTVKYNSVRYGVLAANNHSLIIFH